MSFLGKRASLQSMNNGGSQTLLSTIFKKAPLRRQSHVLSSRVAKELLPHMTRFNASYIGLKQLPPDMILFHNITILNISNNKIRLFDGLLFLFHSFSFLFHPISSKSHFIFEKNFKISSKTSKNRHILQ